MQTLNGKWTYRSYCPMAGAAGRPATIAAPWAPLGELTVSTDESGAVSGTLAFGPKAQLKVTGGVKAAQADMPEGVELTAEGMGAVYLVRGYFAAGGLLVGVVLSLGGDIAKQPAGTLGAFVLLAV
ncbi:MAG: hypothetical protein JNK48_14045 [Bryobacterales bacterium]|nr:hypothetical protein [Bryobacterales bacterium]